MANAKQVKRPWWLVQLDRAEMYYRHCRLGMTAHPSFSEENEDLTSFGIPVQLKVMGVHDVPVMPWGWHPYVGEA